MECLSVRVRRNTGDTLIKKKSESRSKIKAVPGFEWVVFMTGFIIVIYGLFMVIYTIKRQARRKVTRKI